MLALNTHMPAHLHTTWALLPLAAHTSISICLLLQLFTHVCCLFVGNAGGRTIVPGVTAAGIADGADATGAGSGLGSMVDMSSGSSLSTPTTSNDPFSITTGTNMNGANGVLGGGTSASAQLGMGGGAGMGGATSALAQRRQSRVAATSSSTGIKANTAVAGALMVLALLVL